MRQIFVLSRREILSALVSPAMYAIFASVLLLLGYFFFSLLAAFQFDLQRYTSLPVPGAVSPPNLNKWVVEPYWQTVAVLLVFLIPLFTMRSLAEGKKKGTLEYLMTLPLTTTQIVFSKFIAASLVVAALLIGASFYPILLCVYGNPEIPPVFSGLCGVLLIALSYVAIGLAVSSWTSNSLLAGVVSTIANLLLYVIHTPSENNSGVFYDALRSLSLRLRMTEMIAGVLSTASFFFFIMFVVFFLFISNAGLQALRSR